MNTAIDAKWAGITPRRWQAEALPLILQSLRRRERGIVSAIMGSGKSVLIARICASGRGRVLVTVPTIRLVEQLSATIAEQCPGEVGRYFTDEKTATARITVACIDSVPTLVKDPAWPGPPALWIADECHATQAPTILSTYADLAPQRAIGFTATPFRASESEELSLWDREIYTYGVRDALQDGVIVPFRVLQWDGKEDADLDEACRIMIQKHGEGPGLVNATSIDDAEQFAEFLTASGVRAEAVHSKLPREEIAARLDRLRAGALAAVVHVNMLAEGVDFPWLRWLCLRRKVGSRVRFCQEVGRVLRAHPGKTEAVLLDPHDLMGALALSYEAVLAGMVQPEEDVPYAEELREAEKAAEAQGKKSDPTLYPVTLIAWRRYLRSLYLGAVGAGIIECRVKSTRWRRYPATTGPRGQVQMIEKLLGGMTRDTSIPLPHRKMLATVAKNAETLSRGDCSDLISLEIMFKEGRKRGENAWERLTAA